MKAPLHVHPGHLSAITREVIDRRNTRPSGRPMFRDGDPVLPMFRRRTFSLERFSRVYDDNPRRIEEAFPLDLLFLHQLARRNGHDALVLDPAAAPDARLPWYGGGNRIIEMGQLLEGQSPRLSNRKTRHLDEAGRIEAIAPGQVRSGRLDLDLRALETDADPEGDRCLAP